MSQRDSRRFGILINNPTDTSLQPVIESPNQTSSLPSPPPENKEVNEELPTFKYNDEHPSNTMERETSTAHLTAATSMADPAYPSSPAASSPSSAPPSAYRHNRSRSQSHSSRRKQSSTSRRAPPSGLTFETNKLGPPRKNNGDFPSPGRAPRGQRIFDASGYAEKKEGVEVAQPGWAVDSRAQDKLEDNHYREEHPEEQENMGQRIQRSLSTVKRSASMSVKRAKSLRRPRGNSNNVERLNSMEEDPVLQRPPPFEDEDAKMVRLSVIKPHD